MSNREVDWSQKTFRLHEAVSVTLVGEPWGSGIVVDKSTSDFGGSLLYPVYCVQASSGDQGWFPAVALEKN